MSVKDVSHWMIDNEKSASGTRTKYWLVCPDTNERYLFKLPKPNTGEVWAEKVAAEIGKILGLNMMDTQISSYGGRMGILLKNFVDYRNEELFHGGDLISAVLEEFDPWKLDEYTIDNIILAYCSDKNRFYAFTNRSKSIIEACGKRKPKMIVLLDEIRRQYPDRLSVEMKRLHNLSYDNIVNICDQVPDFIMSPLYKKWVTELLLYRIEWLKTWYEGG